MKMNNTPTLPFNFDQKLMYRESIQQLHKIVVRLDDDIEAPVYYGDVIERMNELTENDEVEIIVNTNGGNLDGCLAIVNAINNCQANIICVIDGMAASAGSVIALACPNIAISPFGRMMIHAPSYGDAGKLNERKSSFDFTDKWLTTIIKDTYEGFLTQSEIETVIKGGDFYFDADQIIERLEQRAAYFDKKLKEEAKRIEKEQKEEEANALRSQVSVAKPKKVKKQTTPDTLESNISV